MKKFFKNLAGNNNLVLIFLLTGSILNDFVLRALTIGVGHYWKPIAASIFIILSIGTLTNFLSYKNRNHIFVILSWLFSVINIANYLYYKHFNSFLSIFLIRQLVFLKGIKGGIAKTIDFRIFIFLIPNIIFLFILKKLDKMGYFKEANRGNVKREIFRPLVMALMALALVLSNLSDSDYSRIIKQWNRPYLVEQLGIYSYTTADLVKKIFTPNNPSSMPKEEAINILENIIEENADFKDENQYSNIFAGRDIYVIHYESAENFVIDEELDGIPITPFLNKMAREGLYFNNFYPQHSTGTSSDSEFTFNTSLLPISNGTVFVTHSDRKYLTLEKLLKEKGYYTMSMHGNDKDFWNRDIMHYNLGYDRFFSKEDYVIDEEIGLGLSDMSFFRQSVGKIKRIKEEHGSPILATLITLTNHYPFDDVEKYGDFDVGHLEGTNIGNYFKSYHYADKALESFVTSMDGGGLLDNAIIVLYGDHHANIPLDDYEKFFNYDKNTQDYYSEDDNRYTLMDQVFCKQLQRTPFIIWSKDGVINETIDTAMGMVDALPTLANMIGIFNPYQLGSDIMSLSDNTVVFPDTSWIDNEYYYSAPSTIYYTLDNKEVEEGPLLSSITENAENEIEISNNIVNNNLIKTFEKLFAKHNRFRLPST